MTATNDVDALLALKPDVVVYNPMWIDVDELVRILEAGVNVVASASFITGHNLGDGRDRLADACQRGGSTLFGSGVSPGFAELLAIVAGTAATASTRSPSPSPPTPPSTTPPTPSGPSASAGDRRPGAAADGREGHRGVRRGGADWSPTRSASSSTRSRCDAEYAQTTEDLADGVVDHPGRASRRACSPAGRESSNGKTVIDINVRWKKGQTLEPDWQIDGDGWKITIDGRPTVDMQVGFLPPPDMIENAKTLEDFFVLGHIMTAMPPIHAIPAVVAAAPGIATYNDLPLLLPARSGARPPSSRRALQP